MKRQAKDIISVIVVSLLIIIAIGAITSFLDEGESYSDRGDNLQDIPGTEISTVIPEESTGTEISTVIPEASTNTEETETDDGAIHFPPMDF